MFDRTIQTPKKKKSKPARSAKGKEKALREDESDDDPPAKKKTKMAVTKSRVSSLFLSYLYHALE